MADGSDKTSKGIQKRLKREAHPRPLPREGRRSLSPNPSPKREGSKMQIDLANTLVHKVYFVYHALFIIARKLGLPSFGGAGGGFGRGGWGRLPLKRGGHTDKRVNHKVNFDFD